MSSRTSAIFMAMQGATSRKNEAAVFIDEAQYREGSRSRENLRPYVPTALLTAALLICMVVQLAAAIGDRQRLNAVRAGQETALQDAMRIRARLDGIASDTAKLATDGDPAARVIRDDLRRIGIQLPALNSN
jgi:hypothetical protein